MNDFVLGAPVADAGARRAYIVYGNASSQTTDLDVSTILDDAQPGVLLVGSTEDSSSTYIGFAVSAAGCVS